MQDYMVLPLFTPDASREALGYVAELPILDRDDGLVDLEKLSLVNHDAGRFVLLLLTKTFALAELDRQPDLKKQASERWVDYLKAISKAPEGEYHWRYRDFSFHQEGANLLEALEWAYNYGTANDIFELTLAADSYLDAIGGWTQTLAIKQRALDLAISIQHQIYHARFAGSIGWHNLQQGDYEAAKERFLEAITTAFPSPFYPHLISSSFQVRILLSLLLYQPHQGSRGTLPVFANCVKPYFF